MAERRAVIGVVSDPDGNLLLGRKVDAPGHPFSGLWHLPGGKAEPGETDVQALVREMGEETGLNDLVITSTLASCAAPDGGTWTWFACTTNARTATAGDDLADAGFFTLAEVAQIVTPTVSDLWPAQLRRTVFGPGQGLEAEAADA